MEACSQKLVSLDTVCPDTDSHVLWAQPQPNRSDSKASTEKEREKATRRKRKQGRVGGPMALSCLPLSLEQKANGHSATDSLHLLVWPSQFHHADIFRPCSGGRHSRTFPEEVRLLSQPQTHLWVGKIMPGVTSAVFPWGEVPLITSGHLTFGNLGYMHECRAACGFSLLPGQFESDSRWCELVIAAWNPARWVCACVCVAQRTTCGDEFGSLLHCMSPGNGIQVIMPSWCLLPSEPLRWTKREVDFNFYFWVLFCSVWFFCRCVMWPQACNLYVPLDEKKINLVWCFPRPTYKSWAL